MYAVIFHYCTSRHQTLLQLRIFSVAGTVLLLLGNYDSTVDTYFAMKYDLSSNSYMAKYDDYGTIGMGLGYFCLYFLFVLKLKHSFQDTLFEISQVYIKMLTSLGIIGMTLCVCGAIMFITKQESFGFVFNGSTFIFLAETLFSTLYNYLHYKHVDIDGDHVRNNNNNTDKKNDNVVVDNVVTTTPTRINMYKTDTIINSREFQAFVRLVVVYSSALLSTIIMMAVYTATGNIMKKNKVLYNQWAMWNRLLIIGDSFVNIPCLLFQNISAIKLYKKCCCICHTCIMKHVERKINKDINNKIKNMQELKVQDFSGGTSLPDAK